MPYFHDVLSKLTDGMKYNPVSNYVIPGLTSSLIGDGHLKGRVRMFEQSRTHEEPIVPHSHRFDFVCLVLAGSVKNRIWSVSMLKTADHYMCTTLRHMNVGFGTQEKITKTQKAGQYSFEEWEFRAGQFYEMTHDQIHSIYFSKGAKVLFFEGPQKADHSVVLEPIVDGNVIPTFRVDDWMFQSCDTM